MSNSMTFFSLTDWVATFGWLIIFIAIAHLIRSSKNNDEDFKYYLPNFYIKIISSILFGLVYTVYYEDGGDTVYYWVTATKLNDVFYLKPSFYFSELMSNHPVGELPGFYTKIGRPPHWIYHEPSSFFVSKFASFFSFFCLKSYFALNLMFAVMSSWVSWIFFKFVRKNLNLPANYAAIATLFIPSVNFWCSGVIKDTLVFMAVILLVINIFQLIKGTSNNRLISLIIILASCYILLNTRSFMLLTAFTPLLVLIIFRLNNNKPFIIRFLTRITGILVTSVGLLFYMGSYVNFGEFSSSNVLETAELIHNDFSENETYTGKKYDLGISDFSASSLIRAFPFTVITSLYRPFLWEVDGALMLFNGIEGSIFIYFTFQLLLGLRRREKLYDSDNKDFYLYALIFVITLGFFVGLTSILFGTLARLKAPLLPFFLLLLFSAKQQMQLQAKKNKSNDTET